jgi:hypothetical protein
MSKDPWTDPDPQPGDFDADLATLGPDDVEVYEGDPDARLTVLVGVKGEDAERLERIATERGQRVDEVVTELLRDAERHAA